MRSQTELVVPVAILLIGALTGCYANQPVHYFAPNTYAFTTLGSYPTVAFEAQLAQPIPLVYKLDPKHGGAGFSLSFTPLFRVRIFQTASSPTRPPSYMPKFDAMVMHLLLDRPNHYVRLFALHVTLGHHSNGQDGCSFRGSHAVRDPETGDRAGEDCVVDDPVLYAQRKPNLVDGDFSSNYVAVHLHVRWGRLQGTDEISAHSITLGGELYPPHFLGGTGLNDDFYPIFGYLRGDLGYTYARELRRGQSLDGELRAGASYQAISGLDGNPAPASVLSLEASYSPQSWYGLGAFVRAYGGRDYYNLDFTRTIYVLQVGLLFSYAGLNSYLE